MPQSKYLSELDDFMEEKYYDVDISIACRGKATKSVYDKFLKDTWGTDDIDKIIWYNVCFWEYLDFQSKYSNKEDHYWTWDSDREKEQYITMAIINEACLNNRMDILKYIFKTGELDECKVWYDSKNHTWLEIFERCVDDKNIEAEIIYWILRYNKKYNFEDGVRESDIYDAVTGAWYNDNKNVIELFYDINPKYVWDDENKNLDELFNTACIQNKLDIAKWIVTLDDNYHVIIENDKIIKHYLKKSTPVL